MWKRSKQVAAFTLLECLVALLVLSGGLLVFDGLSRLLAQEIRYQSGNAQTDWLIFSEQFRKELEGVSLEKVENQRLYVEKERQSLSFGQSKKDDFRKTNDKGQGFQPMLYGLKTVKMQQEGNLISIVFQFKDGLERAFYYEFPS